MSHQFAHRLIILGVGYAVVSFGLVLFSAWRARGMDEETRMRKADELMRRMDNLLEVNDDEDHKWFGI
jgi:hypothetical protein